jgi:hypothetical protein
MRSRWLMVAGLTVALATPTTVAARSTAPPVAKVHPAAGAAPTAAAAAARWRPTRDTFTFVVGDVMSAPRVVRGADGRRHLPYELRLLNTGFLPVAIHRIDTLDARTGAALASRSGAALTALIKRPEGGDYTGTLGPGLSGIVVLDVALPRHHRVPRALVHRISVAYDRTQLPPGLADSTTYRTARTRVVRQRAVVLSPPLRGSGWVAANGCCATRTDHRGGAIPVNGRLRLPERFAIDFVRLDRDRRLFSGPVGSLSSYAYYGADVLSVADGVVVRTHDGEPEQTPPDFPPPFDPETAGGNWLVVRIGHGQYAAFAHLQPGSLTVRPGDRVRSGQVLGRLGNSGSTTAPHLHFQVMDRPSVGGADGRPYEFARFRSAGTVTDEQALFAGEPTPVGPALAGSHRRQLPLNLQVASFR